MDSVGEGEGGKIWENGIETCVVSCMKGVASPKKKKKIVSKKKKKESFPTPQFKIINS